MCDMNTWYTPECAGPCRARTWFPKTRTPLPRSHTTYSLPPPSSLMQGELPPKVCETAKSSSLSTQARALSCVSRLLPDAATMALASLSRIDAESSATGIEPRVPQNVTHSPATVSHRASHRRQRDPPGKAWQGPLVRTQSIQKRG